METWGRSCLQVARPQASYQLATVLNRWRPLSPQVFRDFKTPEGSTPDDLDANGDGEVGAPVRA